MTRPRGSLKKQSDGRWVARYSAGDDPITGKRVQRWKTFDEKRDAQRWLTAEHAALDSGRRQCRAGGGPTLAAYIRDYYANDRRGIRGRMLAPRTCAIDVEMFDRYVCRRAPDVADTVLGKLTTDQFSRLFRTLASGDDLHAPLARATVDRVYRILAARLTHAVKLGLLRANPMRADLVMVDGKPPTEKPVLSPAQTQAFLALCSQSQHGVFFALCAWTGMRPGEVAGLTWSDVDEHDCALIVRRSLVRQGGRVELRATKTERTRRVPIPDQLVVQIQNHRVSQREEKRLAGKSYTDLGLVFATPYGKPIHTDNVVRRHLKPFLVRVAYHLIGEVPPEVPPPSRSEAYREALADRRQADAAALQEAGLSLRGLYGLRHTHATLLFRQKVHPKIISDRLGHSRMRTTLDQYLHVAPDMQNGAVSSLQDLLTPHADPEARVA